MPNKKTYKYKKKKKTSVALRYIALIILAIGLFFALIALQNHLRKNVDPNPPMPEGLTKAQVIWVSDGDTIICRFTGQLPQEVSKIIGEVDKGDKEDEYYVRLIGYDSPESVHPDENKNTEEGRLASEFVKKELQGKEVYLEFDTQIKDKYNRILAYVWLEGALFNKRVIEEGHGELLDIPPNTKYSQVFEETYYNRNK